MEAMKAHPGAKEAHPGPGASEPRKLNLGLELQKLTLDQWKLYL
jgi:hypothetical protein